MKHRYEIKATLVKEYEIDLDEVDVKAVSDPMGYALDLTKRELQSELNGNDISEEDFEYSFINIRRLEV